MELEQEDTVINPTFPKEVYTEIQTNIKRSKIWLC